MFFVTHKLYFIVRDCTLSSQKYNPRSQRIHAISSIINFKSGHCPRVDATQTQH
jgi:hypothetical protein